MLQFPCVDNEGEVTTEERKYISRVRPWPAARSYNFALRRPSSFAVAISCWLYSTLFERRRSKLFSPGSDNNIRDQNKSKRESIDVVIWSGIKVLKKVLKYLTSADVPEVWSLCHWQCGFPSCADQRLQIYFLIFNFLIFLILIFFFFACVCCVLQVHKLEF